MATRTYTLSFTPHDARSTDVDELLYQIRTGPNGTGDILATGRATDNVLEVVVVVDTLLVDGIENTRYIRIYDGAANPIDTEYTVQAPVPVADFGSPVQSVGFLYEWRDHRGTLIADITGAVIPGGEVVLRNDRAMPYTMSLTVDPSRLPAGFDPETSHVQINGTITQDGQTALYPIGLFSLDVASDEATPAGDPFGIGTATANRIWAIQGVDVLSHLEVMVEAPYSVAAGGTYRDAIVELIESVRIPDFAGVATSLRYTLPADDTLVPIALPWPAGATVLRICNDLCAGINWYPLASDQRGQVFTRARRLPADETLAVTYTTTAEPRMIVMPWRRVKTNGAFANRVLMTIGDPSRAADYAYRENADPDSHISTAVERIHLLQLQQPRIVDTAVLVESADVELSWINAQATRASLRTVFDPRRGPREFYGLEIADVEDQSHWVVLGWRMPLSVGGIMEHDLGTAARLRLITVAL